MGRVTSRFRGGRHKRLYRVIDFKRLSTDGVPARVASHRVRSEPFRQSSHCCTTRTARRHTSWPPRASLSAPTVTSGPKLRNPRGQLPPACEHPRRHHDSLCGAEAGPRRAARPLGRQQRDAPRPRGRLATLRLPSGEVRLVPVPVSRHHRRSRQRGPRTGEDRQGRPPALDGQAPPQPRRRR
jgi:large subunit ribosomal protein L2